MKNFQTSSSHQCAKGHCYHDRALVSMLDNHSHDLLLHIYLPDFLDLKLTGRRVSLISNFRELAEALDLPHGLVKDAEGTIVDIVVHPLDCRRNHHHDRSSP